MLKLPNIYCSTVTCDLRPAFCTCRVRRQGANKPSIPSRSDVVCVQFVWLSNKNTEKIEGCEQLCRIGTHSLILRRPRSFAVPFASRERTSDVWESGYCTHFLPLPVRRLPLPQPPPFRAISPWGNSRKQCVHQSLILFTCRKLQIECHHPLALVGKQLWSKAEVRTGGHQLILPKHSPFEYSGLLASGVFPAFCRLDRLRHRRSQSTRLV